MSSTHKRHRQGPDDRVDEQPTKRCRLSPPTPSPSCSPVADHKHTVRLCEHLRLRIPVVRSPSSPHLQSYHEYDPQFGQKVQARWDLRSNGDKLELHIRTQKYGKEIAEEYRRGSTPEDIRADSETRQRLAEQEFWDTLSTSYYSTDDDAEADAVEDGSGREGDGKRVGKNMDEGMYDTSHAQGEQMDKWKEKLCLDEKVEKERRAETPTLLHRGRQCVAT